VSRRDEKLVEGKIQHRGHFAFLIAEADGGQDLYLSGRTLKLAMDGDRVAARITGRRGTKLSGEIVRVITRGKSTVVGELRRAGKAWALIPEGGELEDALEVISAEPGVKLEEKVLAALKIHVDDLPVIAIGQSDALVVGDVVLAIGNPFGVGQTVTMGIVSATGRSGLDIATFENFIQTDAAINPGNSGGALINAFGQLVGVNTAIFSRSGGSQGIGFAIPTSVATKILEQLIANGHAIRGWLGIEVQDITPQLSKSFQLNNNNGVLVAGVLKNGPAHRAGFRAGDIIVGIEGLNYTHGREMMNQVAQALPGETLMIEVVRNQQTIRISTVVGLRPQRN